MVNYYDHRENYYALKVAVHWQIHPDRAFMMMEGEAPSHVKAQYREQELIAMYHKLKGQLGRKPTQKDWELSELTPSKMPVRTTFGKWSALVSKAENQGG